MTANDAPTSTANTSAIETEAEIIAHELARRLGLEGKERYIRRVVDELIGEGIIHVQHVTPSAESVAGPQVNICSFCGKGIFKRADGPWLHDNGDAYCDTTYTKTASPANLSGPVPA